MKISPLIIGLFINVLLLSIVTRQAYADDYEKALIASQQHAYDEANIYIRNVLRDEPQHLPATLLYATNFIAQATTDPSAS